jgi:ELWxxDGT repeat protein
MGRPHASCPSWRTRGFLRPLLAVLSFSCALPAAAQFEADLVAEIVPGPGGAELLYGFGPVYDGRLFFVAETPELGKEVWAYDGATDEVALVADINPGPGDGVAIPTFALYDGRLFFNATDGETGQELWAYDAATDEVSLVDDTFPGASGNVVQVVAYDDRVFFTGFGILWAYDASTDAVTQVIEDSFALGVVGNLTVFDGRLFFSAFTEQGIEPAFYDAATGDSGLLADLYAGTGDSQPLSFVPYDGRLFFSAITAATGRELFVYDPAADAVTLAADVVPGPQESGSFPRTVFDGRLFFGAVTPEEGPALWAYDAATDAATLQADLTPGPDENVLGVLLPFGGVLPLIASTPETGDELFAFDPATGEATLATEEIRPGPAGASINGVALYGDRLFFSADDGISGQELWALSEIDTSTDPELASDRFGLRVAYPNPARDRVTLGFALRSASRVRLEVFDLLGRSVAVLAARPFAAGDHRVTWESGGEPAGVYVARLTIGEATYAHRLTLVR